MKSIKFIIWILILTVIISTIYPLVTNWNEIAVYWKIILCDFVIGCIIGLVSDIVDTIQDYQIDKLIEKLCDNTNKKENKK